MESDKSPKRSLASKIREAIRRAIGKTQRPFVPEGSKPEPVQVKPGEPMAEHPEDVIIRRQDFERALKSLTPRERQIYDLVIQGHTNNAEIGRMLGVGREAVRKNREAMESKFRRQFNK